MKKNLRQPTKPPEQPPRTLHLPLGSNVEQQNAVEQRLVANVPGRPNLPFLAARFDTLTEHAILAARKNTKLYVAYTFKP